MKAILRELLQLVGLLVSLAALATGLIMIDPGLALAAAGLAGVTLWVLWIRRDRPVPGVREEPGLPEFRHEDPDDDGRMEVRPL